MGVLASTVVTAVLTTTSYGIMVKFCTGEQFPEPSASPRPMIDRTPPAWSALYPRMPAKAHRRPQLKIHPSGTLLPLGDGGGEPHGAKVRVAG